MNGRDPHRALKSEIINKASSQRVSFIITKLQWGKDDIAFSLHAQSNSFGGHMGNIAQSFKVQQDKEGRYFFALKNRTTIIF